MRAIVRRGGRGRVSNASRRRIAIAMGLRVAKISPPLLTSCLRIGRSLKMVGLTVHDQMTRSIHWKNSTALQLSELPGEKVNGWSDG